LPEAPPRRGQFLFMSNRKAFNFFRSYYEVANELTDKDRLAFYDALMLEQFTGRKSELKGMAKFAYISQQHSIDSQINGFNQRLKRGDISLEPLSSLPPTAGATPPPTAQEKEKEKEEGKVNIKPCKISFEESTIFHKMLFKETFPNWSQDKLRHYYDAALRYSVEGNKYVSWELAIKQWERKDKINNVLVEKPTQKVIIW
jgi:hypothetical protein